ncbi:MAG: hypothetical protein H0V29_09105 [Thermoleophilaceae bacterium]|nr:hypothetical protein [Thermoleophilaceae bacterium]
MSEDEQKRNEQSEASEASDEVKQEMKDLEENPPEKIEDWPSGEAKYQTFGGREGEHSYADGPEQKLGEAGVRHHSDGKVSVDGEEVDNPDDYKGEPIPGGPTDPNTPNTTGETVDGEDREDSDAGAAT